MILRISWLMLGLPIWSYANGNFSSRRIERATHGNTAMRFVAANLHPDHDTIATFCRASKTVFEAAFLQVLLLTRETGLLRPGTVSIDSTKIDANAPKICSDAMTGPANCGPGSRATSRS